MNTACEAIRAALRDQGTSGVTTLSAEVAAHLNGCAACAAFRRDYESYQGVLERTLGQQRISDGFERKATERLQARRAAMTGDTSAKAITSLHLGLSEEDMEREEAAPAGFLDALAARFGAAPWWIISGAFHGLLITLLFLIGLAIMQIKKSDTVILTSLEKQKEKEPEKEQPPRDIFKNPQPLETTETVNPQPEVVMHEEVEVSDHLETDDDMNQQDAFGDEGISDIPLGGSGVSAALGVGGGGAGAFGRPSGGGAQRLRRAIAGGGDKKTESAVDKGLEWLARHQEADGHWDCGKYGGQAQHADVAMTGFALLAFLGAGHTEKVGKYKDTVRRAVEWLGKQQDGEGCYAPQTQFSAYCGYNHSIAAISMAEAAAMGRVTSTRESAQKAVDYSVNLHQCGDDSEKRGWRYHKKQEGDLSNSGWFVMQLKSAKVAGLNVPHGGFEGADWFLNHVEDKTFLQQFPHYKMNDYDTGRHRYGYTGPGFGYRTTAIGILCRQFMGWEQQELQGGVEYFCKYGGLPANQKVDLYYWYYGTLCCFQQGGEIWKNWNEGLKGALLPTQRQGGDEDGSWDPTGEYASHWGRVGQTALSVLCLEVYYRYLPMYR